MKTNMENNLEEILNLPASNGISDSKEISTLEETDDKQEQDFELGRQNLHEIIDQGKRALDELCDIANASQHPRAYEVVATLIKTVSDANSNLMNLHKQKKDVTKAEKPNHVTNSLFIGSTEELLKIVKPRDNAKVIDQ